MRTMLSFIIALAVLLPLIKPDYAQDTETAHQYCQKVDNDDRVRSIPSDLLPYARRLYPYYENDVDDYLLGSTVYRCMNGEVFLCNYGANIPCTKADLSRHLASVDAYCKEVRNDNFVPMAATGHATIYTWRCVDGKVQTEQTHR